MNYLSIKNAAASLLVVSALAMAAAPAMARSGPNEINIATLTCADLQKMDADAIGIFLTWMDGYLGGQSEDTIFNLQRLEDNADEVARVCERNQRQRVLAIMQRFEDSQQ